MKAATSSSAAVSCCSTCRGSRPSSRTAHQTPRPHRPPHPRRDRLLPSALGHRARRCQPLRVTRRAPRTAGRTRTAARARRAGARSCGGQSRGRRLSGAALEALLAEAGAARSAHPRSGLHQQLHRDPCMASMAEAILQRVPPELDALNEKVVVTACLRLGFKVDGPAREAHLLDRVRRWSPGRQPARRTRRFAVGRHVRP